MFLVYSIIALVSALVLAWYKLDFVIQIGLIVFVVLFLIKSHKIDKERVYVGNHTRR